MMTLLLESDRTERFIFTVSLLNVHSTPRRFVDGVAAHVSKARIPGEKANWRFINVRRPRSPLRCVTDVCEFVTSAPFRAEALWMGASCIFIQWFFS
jgi:hypothetical protein